MSAKTALAAVGLAVLPALATAAPVTFNYLDLDYVQHDPAKGDDDAVGYGATLSAPIPGSSNFLYGRYSKVEFDGPSSGDVENLRVGLGLVSQARGAGGMYTLITFERIETAGVREDGYGGEMGFRMSLGQYFELGAAARYLDLKDSGDDTGYSASAVVSLTPTFALVGHYLSIFDADEIRVGLRLTMAPE